MRANQLTLLALVAGAIASGVAYGQNDPPSAPNYPYQDQPGQYQPGQGQPDQYPAGQYPPDYQDPSGYDGQQDPSTEVGFFYNELSPYGEWVNRDPYGWVWFPRDVNPDWRPYRNGRWVNSDYGWTWVSDEPFGWATYHYGRWAWDPEIGWLWVPGTVWAPAWVSWQHGGGYVGWAPLPPEVGVEIGIGLRLGDIDLRFAIQPTLYSFVEERQFLEPQVATYILPPARNVTIIQNTTNITNYTFVNNRVVNNGVPVNRIEQVTGRRVQRLRLAEVASPTNGGAVVQSDVLRIYRPPEARLQTVRAAARNNAGLRAASAPQQPDVQGRPMARPEPAPGTAPLQPARRMRVAPRVQPAAQPSVDRQQQQQDALKRQQDEERRRLAAIHQQEMAQAKGQAAQEVAQRHAAELQAQQQQQQRAEQQLRNRQEVARQAAQAKPNRGSQPPPPDRKNKDKRNPQPTPPPPG